MLQVPAHIRSFLTAKYDLAPNTAMFTPANEPKKVYLERGGTLHVVSFTSPSGSAGRGGYSATPKTEPQFDRREMGSGRSVLNGVSETEGVESVYGPQRWQSMSDAERGILQKEHRKAIAYKTALCQAFKENGFCYYGDACRFAHGEHELRLPPQVHPKHKTQLCNKFALFGRCPYGPRCQFIHRRPTGIAVPNPDLQSSLSDGKNRGSLETGNGSNLFAQDDSFHKFSSGTPGFSSSLSAEQFGSAMSLWEQRPSTAKTEDLGSDGLSRSSEKSEKKIEDSLDGINAGISRLSIWSGNGNWPDEPENNFARSCFPRLQNGSIWHSDV